MPARGRCALAGVVVLPIVLLASPAEAATGPDRFDVAVDLSAWSWRTTLPAGLPVTEPSRVPEGGLAVASDGDPQGRPSKATYLHLDLGVLTAGSRVDELRVTLPLDAAGESSDSTAVRLVACRLTAPFQSGEGSDPATMPQEDCTGAPTGRFDPAANGGTGAWTFALTALAQEWAADPASNHGVVVRPPADYLLPADLPFQLAFSGAEAIRGEMVAAVPAALGPSAPAPSAAVEAAPPAFFPMTPPPALGGLVTPVEPSVALPAPTPVTAPVPDVAAVAAPVTRVTRALPPPRATSGALWSLGAFAAMLLAGVSRVVGNTSGPYALARLERQRLDRLRLQVPIAAPEEPVVPAQLPQIRQGRRPMSSAASIST